MPRWPWATRIRRAGMHCGKDCASPAWMRRAIVAQASASSRSSAAAPGGGAAQAIAAGMPAPTSSPRRSARPGSYGLPFTFFGSPSALLAVQAPERHLGMDLEHARGHFRIGAHGRVDLADLRRDHEQLLRDLARRVGRLERHTAGLPVVRRGDRAARRDREHRGLALSEQRPHGVLRPASAGAGASRQADRHVDRDDRRAFGRREDAGKGCLDPDADFVSRRTHESDDPAGGGSHPRPQASTDQMTLSSLTARPSATRS